uniref:Uncharacterized protein n=1 Tax=Alexandrium catenella TaxID=2925 RepID=A0A7S1QNG0_ALECA|mmetsp:Transcript_35545/g.96363  ORF Transcript_35545/g.96363 Transcript_35545/m.96363 type:complete len:306 (+) Transcript_35545:38-955(+)
MKIVAPWEPKPCARGAVLEAFRQTWLQLPRGTDTEQLVDTARQCWEGMCSSSAGLFLDCGFRLQVLGEALRNVEGSLRRLCTDRDSMCQAMSDNLSVLEAAAEEPLEREELMLVAGRRHWEGLWRAAWELRAGSELVLEAVRQCWEALRLAPCSALADVERALESVRQRWSDQWLASRELREDRETVLKALKYGLDSVSIAVQCPGWSHSRGQPLPKDLRRTWTALMLAVDELLEDWEVVRASVVECLRLLRNASDLVSEASTRGDTGGRSSLRLQARVLMPPVRSAQLVARVPVAAHLRAGGIV